MNMNNERLFEIKHSKERKKERKNKDKKKFMRVELLETHNKKKRRRIFGKWFIREWEKSSSHCL